MRSGERVFEFGAGNSVVADTLPAGCTYTGSDVMPLRDSIITFDLNAHTLFRLRGFDVALFCGVLEYVHDLPKLSAFLSTNFCSVVCSYATLTCLSLDEIDQRRYSGWFNDFTETQLLEIFQRENFRLSRQGKWGNQTLFRLDR